MTTTHIPVELNWKPQGSMTHFYAVINYEETFQIAFDVTQPVGYQWRLLIWRKTHDQGVFLHGHFDLDEAKQAARRHLGMD